MVSDETTQRLRTHAGLDQPRDASSPAVASCTGPGSARRNELDTAVQDFTEALDALNHELNGEIPSESVGSKAAVIPTDVAYAVAEVARMLREEPASAREAWLVETAWLAVLSGDIDDLRHHLADEETARERLQ
jgi:hypothetical protein